MERDVVSSRIRAGLRQASAPLLLVAALLSPDEAVCQSRSAGYARVWSSAAGIAGKRVPGRLLPALPEERQVDDSPQTAPAAPAAAPLPAAEPQARAALRYDGQGADETGQTEQIKAETLPQQDGVRVDLFVDRQTHAALRQMSAEMGIPYEQALSEFLRVARTIYTERLLCASPLYYPAR